MTNPSRLIAAILASCLQSTAVAGDAVTLDRPQPMRVGLADGRSVSGTIERWDEEGFVGAIGRFRWDELAPTEAFRVRKRLIELGLPSTRKARLLELAQDLWAREDGNALAERAARDARSAGASDAEVAAAKRAAELRRTEREEREATSSAARLRSTSPEGGTFTATAWGPIAAAIAEAELQNLKVDVASRLAKSGREATAVEGDSCLVWSDLGVTDGARRTVDLDGFVAATMTRLLGDSKPNGLTLRPGKIAVIVVEGEERFRIVNAAAFGQVVPASLGSITHYDGPNTFVVVRKQADEVSTLIESCRGVAKAILHRIHAPLRLPPWAQEGLADWLVLAWPKTKAIDRELRAPGLAFLRQGGSLESVLDLTYEEGSWPGPRGIGAPVGYLLVGLMMEQAPDRFLRFLAAAKEGKPWRQALEQDFGTSAALLLERARRHYRVND